MDVLTHSTIGGLMVTLPLHTNSADVSVQVGCYCAGFILGGLPDTVSWIYEKITRKSIKEVLHTSPGWCLAGSILLPMGVHQLSDMFFHSYGERWLQYEAPKWAYISAIALSLAGHFALFIR
jgi:hypothetical protein